MIGSHSVNDGSITLTNDHSGNNIDEWSAQADFANVAGPALVANSGSGSIDLSTLSPGNIETQLTATAFSLLSSSDMLSGVSDLGTILESQIATLSDTDRSFEMSWSGSSGNGNGNGGNNGNAGGNGNGKGKGKGKGKGNGNSGNGGDISLGGRIVGVTVVAVPEPGTYAVMGMFLAGVAFWMRKRNRRNTGEPTHT